MEQASVKPASTTAPADADSTTLRSLSPQQWKSGIAAWLGWLFDGLDMHLYTLVATAFVAILLYGQTFRSEFTQQDADRDGKISAAEWQRAESFSMATETPTEASRARNSKCSWRGRILAARR